MFCSLWGALVMGMTNRWVAYLELQAVPPGLLDQSNFDETVPDSVLNSALIMSATWGHWDVVQLLLEKGAVDVNTRLAGVTALHVATLNEGVATVELLLSCRADVNAQVEQTGWTALHIAVMFGDRVMAELLTRFGADVNGKEKGTGWTALHFAVQRGRVALTGLLTRLGADVNATDENGITPLHVATGARRMDMVEWLLRSGANVNAKSANGPTPMAMAFKFNRMDMVKSMWNAEYSKLEDLEKDTNSPVLSKLKEAFAGKGHHLAATIFKYIRPVNFEDVQVANDDGNSAIELFKQHYDGLHKYVKMLRKAKEQQLRRRARGKLLEPSDAAEPQKLEKRKGNL